MGLLDDAAVFTRSVLEDVDGGFGQAITVWDPFGNKLELKGYANRIGQDLDPQTGMLVSGDFPTVTLAMSRFPNGKLPIGINDSTPWTVEFADRSGKTQRYKVRWTKPDNTAGAITCGLEQWNG